MNQSTEDYGLKMCPYCDKIVDVPFYTKTDKITGEIECPFCRRYFEYNLEDKE